MVSGSLVTHHALLTLHVFLDSRLSLSPTFVIGELAGMTEEKRECLPPTVVIGGQKGVRNDMVQKSLPR